MPRYFFDLYNDIVSIDEEGRVLPDADSAKARGMVEAREMISASVEEHNKVDLRHRIEVRDEAGAIVSKINFENAVRFVRDGNPV